MRTLLYLFLLWTVDCRLSTAATPQPNIILILADDLGYADVGANGHSTDIATPHLDAIAKNGVRFTDGYATHPYCSPSRAGLMSGMYQHRFGFETNSGPEAYAAPNFGLPRSIPTLAEKLKAAGYATGMVGKWHIGFREGLRPWERGFDFFYGFLSGARSFYPDLNGNSPLLRNGKVVEEEPAYLTDALTDEAIAFMEKSEAAPWFLYVAYNAVHTPMEATEELEARFSDIDDPKRRTLAGMLAAMDDGVGRIMEKVRELGEEENTLVLFYSDNGGIPPKNASLNGPLRGMKGSPFEGGIRVPFLAQWTGVIPPGLVYEKSVMGFDCHATALAAAGLSLDNGDAPALDGVDLLPFLTGENGGRPHEALFWRADNQHAARVGEWKLVKTRNEDAMLFDLEADIGEAKDLAESHPEKLAQLENAFAAWSGDMMERQWIRQDRNNAEPGGKLKAGAASQRRGTAAGTAALARLEEIFREADKNGDGKISREEYPRPENFSRVDIDGDGFATLEEIRARFQGGGGNNNRRALQRDVPAPVMPKKEEAEKSGTTMFERATIPGLTDVEAGTNGFAIVDLNRDGWLDFLAVQSEPGVLLKKGPRGNPIRGEDRLRVLLNREGVDFEEHSLTIQSDRFSYENIGRSAQIPNLIDLNGDGFLDIFLSRHAPLSGGKSYRGATRLGNTLLLSDGAWDRFTDAVGTLGAANDEAYNRQTAFGDVDGDGWLDLAVGCDNIGDAMGGYPHSRLYLFRPNGDDFARGAFEDIGGTDRVPDFGGWYHDSEKDKAGPDIQLADLDNDGDLDLLQAVHIDIRDPRSEFTPAEYRQGVFCWRNLLVETGEANFEKVTDNGLAVEGRLRWDEEKQKLVPDGQAPGLPYVALADVDNDGRLDVLAIGPSDPGWASRAEYVGGRFWRNRGDFQFEEATAAAGLESLNWTYREWYDFQGIEIPPHLANWQPRGGRSFPTQPGLERVAPLDERPYWADLVTGDFDNDGWQDFVALDRRDGNTGREGRAVLFHNRGDGTFEPRPQGVSGLDAKGISGEAADLNNDGLLDLVFGADPDNSGGFRLEGQLERYRDKVFLNAGTGGARENHWLRLRFTGASHHALAGARVKATSGGRSQVRTVSSAHAYKSGGPMETHFGLGPAKSADIDVALLDGRSFRFDDFKADQYAELSLADAPSSVESVARKLAPSLGEDFRAWFGKLDANGNRSIDPSELDGPREIRGGDRNADGKISVREGQRYFGDMQATLAARANPGIYEPWKRTEGQTPLRTAESGDPFLNLEFTRDLPTGENDANGTLITGSECLHLETHRGMLFTTLSGWNHDTKRAPWPGASVAVKKSADGPWEVEQNFGADTLRAGSLKSINFTTLATGEKLDSPSALLLCGIGGRSDAGKIVVWTRTNATGAWIKTIAGQHEGAGSPEVRVLFDHVDAVTGIHHVFAAASNGMIFRGSMHPAVEGYIQWHPEPELTGRERRFMAAAELDGTVYLTIDLEPTEPKNGGLFRRIDGPDPHWERVTGWKWSTPNPDTPRPWFGMRGLTALSDGSLLGAREQPGTIDRLDPAAPAGKRVTTEYDVRSALLDAWDFPSQVQGGMSIIAYNDMLPVTHPKTGDETLLIPLGTRHPEGGRMRDTNELGASAWYLVRYGEAEYGLGRVQDPNHPLPNKPSGGLRATRTIRPSPFPEEKDRVWYFAGFDAFGGPSHLNTAWVYRGELP